MTDFDAPYRKPGPMFSEWLRKKAVYWQKLADSPERVGNRSVEFCLSQKARYLNTLQRARAGFR